MFESAALKLKWANHHIADLKTLFETFLENNAHSFIVGYDLQTGDNTIQVRFEKPIPPALSLMIADGIHNLRTALDHATWELIGLDGGTQDRWLTFPTGRDKTSFEATCNGIKTPRGDTKKFFIEFGAYERGPGKIIYGLHLLDNAEKHTTLNPVVGFTRIPMLKIINPEGITTVEMENCAFGMGADGRCRINAGPGFSIEIDGKSNPTLEIFFGNVEIFIGQPIIPMLVRLADAVADLLGHFANFVRTRA